MNPPGSSTSPVSIVCRECRKEIAGAQDVIGRIRGTDFALFNHSLTSLLLTEEEFSEEGGFVLELVECLYCPNQLGGQIIQEPQQPNHIVSSIDRFCLNLKRLLTWDGTTLRYADTNLIYRNDDNVYRFMCRVCKLPIARANDYIRTHRLVLDPGFGFFADNLNNVGWTSERHHISGAYSAFDAYCECDNCLGLKIIREAEPQDCPMLFESNLFILKLNRLLWWDGTRNREVHPNIIRSFP